MTKALSFLSNEQVSDLTRITLFIPVSMAVMSDSGRWTVMSAGTLNKPVNIISPCQQRFSVVVLTATPAALVGRGFTVLSATDLIQPESICAERLLKRAEFRNNFGQYYLQIKPSSFRQAVRIFAEPSLQFPSPVSLILQKLKRNCT